MPDTKRPRFETCEYLGEGRRVVREAWIEQPLEGGWIAAYRIHPEKGRRVVAELRVFPAEEGKRRAGRWSAERLGLDAKVPPGGITSRLIRKARVKTDMRLARELGRWAERLGFASVEPPRSKGKPRRRGRPGRPERFYARLAVAYEACLRQGSRTPLKDLAKEYPRLTKTQLRDAIHRSRKLGFLVGGQPAHPGGIATPDARRVARR